MTKIIKFYKRSGETPLEALGRLRGERPELADEKMTYAGRLDPLAEGELLILVGEECKKKADYLGLDKEYVVDVLFGVGTDTGDVLGLITEMGEAPVILPGKITGALESLVGTFVQKYPAYSSKTIHGQQMFSLARSGDLPDDEDLPEKEVTIYSAELIETYEMPAEELEQKIYEKINSVTGDFRQAEITGRWHHYFQTTPSATYHLAKIKVHCSSGTYMRTLSENLGQKLSLPALAFHINRTKIGN